MADTLFSNGTVIQADWMNDVNDNIYGPTAPAGTLRAQLASTDSPSDGAGMIGSVRSFPDAVATNQYSINEARPIGMRSDFSLVDGDDATAELASAMSAAVGKNLVIDLEGLELIVSSELVAPGNDFTLRGPGKLTAKSGEQFEYLFKASSRSNIIVRDIEFDANQSNRSSGQTVRFMGAAFLGCTDCSFINVTARNVRGYGGTSGVALAIAGNSTRGLLMGCKLLDCGVSGYEADGIFTSGSQNLIAFCQATNGTDTAFVIESSNLSGIIGCTSDNFSAVAAITSASADHKRGNYISGLTGRNWNAASTGGLQIGVPGAFAGNLYDTVIDGLVMYADTSSYGNGAAINIRQLGSGRAIGISVNSPRINGSKNQGILVDGDDVQINNPNIKGTTDACIQFATGTAECEVNAGRLKGGSFGIVTVGTAEATAKSVTTLGQSSAQYSSVGTSTLTVRTPNLSSSITAYDEAAGSKIAAATTGREFQLTYGTTITTDSTKGDTAIVVITNGTGFTMSAPTGLTPGRRITYRIKNASGGAAGAITWNASFALSAWTQPANGFSRSITFKYDGSLLIEESRTTADVPN